MKRAGKLFVLLFALVMFLPAAAYAEETGTAAPEYSDTSNWAYYADGTDTGVDIFMLCPTVDYNDELNATLNEEMKTKFLTGLGMEKGAYNGAGRIYAPYYRQMAMAAYKYAFAEDKTKYVQAMNLAYSDVSAAFRYYLEHENNGRGIILAGFSQGSQMCLELLKEYYGGDSKEAVTLRSNLVSVYAIGWRLSEDTVSKYPQIIPAAGEDDIGTVVSYDCENGELSSTMIIPAGTKALSINPLNWKTDDTEADKSLNLGALMLTTKEIVPGFCGAKIGSRGELIVTGVNADDFPPTIGGVQTDYFPKGHFHIYDYSFFLVNLKKNVITRSEAWRKYRSKITDIPVSSFDVAIESPVCGTKTAAPKVTITDKRVLMLHQDSYDWSDNQGNKFEGKFKGGDTYRIPLDFEPASGYYFPNDIEIKLTGGSFVNANKGPVVASDGSSVLFDAQVTAEHNWDEGRITTQPTTEKAGEKTFTCKGCGATKTEAVEKLPPVTPVKPVDPVTPTAKEQLDTKLPKISIKSPVGGEKTFTAKWKKLSKKNRKSVDGIEIQYARNKKFTTSVKLVKVGKTAASKKISKLAKKKTYYVRIRTYRKAGDVKHFSKWSKVKKIKTR